jgi:hypothetical protein
MAISPQSFNALTTLKSNNALDSLARYIDLLLDPSIGNDEETSYTPYSEADQYLKMRDLIKDGSGEFNSNSEKIELKDYDLNLSQLIFLDENDQIAVDAYSSCIATLVGNAVAKTWTEDILRFYATEYELTPSTTMAQIRVHFYQNNFINAKYDQNVFIIFGFRIYRCFLEFVKSRISSFKDSNTENPEDATDGEERDNSEDTVIESDIGQLEDIYSLFSLGSYYPGVLERTFKGRNLDGITYENYESSLKYVNSFSRVFSNLNLEGLNGLAEQSSGRNNFETIMNKIEEIGLLHLASYAYEISEFAKKRLRNKFTLKRSANDVVDPTVDLPWLISLGEVIQRLKHDPLTFAAISFYFPSLTTFLVDALAVVGDYSDNGKGGGEEDTLNNADDFALSLEKAFGVTSVLTATDYGNFVAIGQTARAIFQMAYKFTNTSQRIQNVLKTSPFRANIAPNTPDNFHLRLGAANFYVPPVSIDVNSNFKTGSLTGAAIRQKNSPKFNSGYKETSIRMRLFFPNYEEIWGLSVDALSRIDLNDTFKIDFKNGGDTEIKIDKFLSSLRGLVAAFKYSPILPIKNNYLNTVHGITAVALSSMSISTIPNYPFALAVDIELLNFNHQPFLPMIKDFNQAIHWGKYRHYMGKAAGHLHDYVNEEFLLKQSDVKEVDLTAKTVTGKTVTDFGFAIGITDSDIDTDPETPAVPPNVFDNDVLNINVISEWKNGNNISLFAPAETQTKIYLPDTSSFRTKQEKTLTDLGQNTWQGILSRFGIDINQSESYGVSLAEVQDISLSDSYSKSIANTIKDSIDILTAGITSDDKAEQIYAFFVTSFIAENKSITKTQADWLKNNFNTSAANYPEQGTYIFQGKFINNVSLNGMKDSFTDISRDPVSYLDLIKSGITEEKIRKLGIPDLTDEMRTSIEKSVQNELAQAFSVSLYQRFFMSGPIQSLMEAARAKGNYNIDEDGNVIRESGYSFKEWEVPMIRVDLDPHAVIINGVTVSMGNSLAKLQIQMQDEPTYQHIGGRDSSISISMTVIGEKELIKLKNVFDHISNLARLEHATGVIGFLGIKNIITALCGIKYVLPLSYNVSTIPNYPHAYSVQLTLIDFDIFQQKREELSSTQQKELIQQFSTKKNPFLRIKQFWGTFNAYPDFPLSLKNSDGDVVGHLDPDYYFRSFEMFDRDVVNSFSTQHSKIQDYNFDTHSDGSGGWGGEGSDGLGITAKILEFIQLYNNREDTIASSDVVQQMKDYIIANQIGLSRFIHLLRNVVTGNTDYSSATNVQLLTDFITLTEETSETNPFFDAVTPARFQQGDLSPNDAANANSIEAALSGAFNIQGEEFVSFDPDEVDFHKQIFTVPASDPADILDNKIPSILQTAAGTHFGYISRDNGRFYLTANGTNIKKVTDESDSANSGVTKFSSNFIKDVQTPETGNTTVNTGVSGAKAVSEYQNAYTGDVQSHWETMMVDASYRDVSGRMLRAFPTYMLWLIDEGGMFAGVKLFDNFYGLQSIIDFSVVSSEDLLGDTLIFRVSNLYSKLTKNESSKIFNPNDTEGNNDPLSLTDGLSSIIERTLNMSKNILGHMRNEYVVDIANIRLKPGVRVHLRAGYGSNPNSLQTLFNGVITNVEQGEIVTITAQSDAIELGAVINSVNKKGSSGKIDGGVDTGMYMSEPRDLMVRLLSMGASRTREAIAHATRGTVFSENRFGIRHFGNILYEPLTTGERAKNDAVRDSITGAFSIAGSNNSFMNKAVGITEGFSMNYRGNTFSAVSQLFANFCAQVDLEIYKRNIYPGNGTGIAQFLGGDLDDGWSTASSLTQENSHNERMEGYLGRLTDRTWNDLISNSELENDGLLDTGANSTLDFLTEDNQLVNSEGRAGLVKGLFGAGITAGVFALGGPVTAAIAGSGLLGVLRGRGGTNLFRTMGIISPNSDDDLPGFDEVSFKAQTYMRTVWDLFQMCARLLPNYIVAVRPFEDRSTVFYGKPHWLYTSGVVPITTGFPGQEKAEELGIIPPQMKQPDQDLISILDKINKDSNPLADYAAFFQASEPSQTIQDMSQSMLTSGGVYAPTSKVAGKILNFYSEPSMTYYDPSDTTKILAKLPVSKGYVNVGLHLPVGVVGGGTEDTLAIQQDKHKQLPNLPPRYSFPYFTANEDLPDDQLINAPFISLARDIKDHMDDSDGDHITEGNKDYYNNLLKLQSLEYIFFEETKQTLIPSDDTINLDNPLNFGQLNQEAIKLYPEARKVMVPLPRIDLSTNAAGSIGSGVIKKENVDDDFSFEYQSDNYGELTYKEWGTPATAEDEQFYIAMRWPYNPVSQSETNRTGADEDTISQFKSNYDFEDLYGTVKDYKSRKVLVYNPTNRRAVVCRPAYFLWGSQKTISGVDSDGTAKDYQLSDAVVSPDAAYYLGVITRNSKEEDMVVSRAAQGGGGDMNNWRNSGFRPYPIMQECFMAFVPDNVPVGVIADAVAPVSDFSLKGENGEKIEGDEVQLIGFGSFKPKEGDVNYAIQRTASGDRSGSADTIERRAIAINDSLNAYKPLDTNMVSNVEGLQYGGNALNVVKEGDQKTYFQAVIDATGDDYDSLKRDNLYEILDDELTTTGGDSGTGRVSFAPVYSPLDIVSVEARSYYDENFDASVSVIAGDGRTLRQAEDIWDQFRFGYHNYESVKQIFFDAFSLDPDNENEFPEFYKNILTGSGIIANPIAKFNDTTGNGSAGALDEFSILLGSDFVNNLQSTNNSSSESSADSTSNQNFKEAIEFARANYIDTSIDKGGIVEYFNAVVVKSLTSINKNFLDNATVNNVLSFSLSADTDNPTLKSELAKKIKTPKQLFLLMVGIFRQRMWEDPYARAWLVLKPDRKKTGDDQWSFKPVDKIFRAFIDPYSDYAKPGKNDKFLKLLAATKGEGNSSTNIVGESADGINDFWNANVGPIFTAIGDGLTGLMSMFQLSMQQMGYALSEAGNFKKQANILNKALNDSIYYSLGRPGTLLRAVDNPFTREYGEPVIEVREPFQRLHYISSFSHILSNEIQENINGVATTVTAVSDGKYPVTVALDKGAPAERQVEKTIETGLYFDNMTGSGFTGFLHPLMHPLETISGIAKNVQGAPDELSARRVALSHLKESIKDIYGGELIVIGNSDIRPHDLIYLADVYERMYGIFEVEQVVHHFTAELGYITSITPNALVTVNDPARWFMTSWIHSWMNVQTIRNDTRMYLSRIRSGNSGVSVGGNVSMDALGEALSPQLLGGLQFTHGSSALVKDVMANQTAQSLPDAKDQLIALASANGGGAGVGFKMLAGGLAAGALLGAVTPIGLVGAAIGGPLVGQLAWKGWSWIRDKVLDQHGCYVQYLSKNGQPMDAGLSYNQGMVVGKYHSKALLPGILGVRAKVRTPEGNAYIRSDDLFKSLGWNESQITDLVRYVSYENALVHARVLKMAGLGPEKAGLEPQFKVLCKVIHFVDGDTIEVEDVLSGATFKVRFDGMNTSEINTMEGKVGYPDTPANPITANDTISLLDLSTPGGKAKLFTTKALTDKIFVLRVNPTRVGKTAVLEQDYEAGASQNIDANYVRDVFQRTIGTIFYYLPEVNIEKHKINIRNLFRSNQESLDTVQTKVQDSMYDESPFRVKFNEIYSKIANTVKEDYFDDLDNLDPLHGLSEQYVKKYNILVYMKILEEIYNVVSEWPQVSWDEYYEDGHPYTLNWELVVNNLARVYVADLQAESDSVTTAEESAAMPIVVGGTV